MVKSRNMANIVSRLFGKKKESRFDEWTNPILGSVKLSSGTNYTESKALKLSTVYRAVNVISDSVAILELHNYQYKGDWKYKQYNKLYYLLNVQPNSKMSAFTFKKNIVQSVLLKGNAYILLKRDKNTQEVIEMELLDTDTIQVLMVNNQLKYQVINTKVVYDSADIVHIMNYSTNGYVGVSTLSYASMCLGNSYNSEEHASNFFSNGANLSGILRPVAGVNLTKDKADKAKESFINSLNGDLNGSSGGIVVLDAGLEYQAISINPKDAQLIENRRFNVITICQFFGVPPSKVFDLSKSSYATNEAQQIDFLNSTLLPILEKIEIEFFRKIFSPVEYDLTELKFDVSNIIRLDSTTQASYFSQLFNMGALSTNEIREKLNLNYPVAGGNEHMIQVNVQPLNNMKAKGDEENK